MPGCVIHVYHESGEQLAAEVRRAAADRRVIALTSREALDAAMPELELVFAPVPPRTGWTRATRLRLIQVLGAGVDSLLPSPDLPAAVEVAGVRGVFAPEVAEHVLAMMLGHVRRLAELIDDQRARRFAPSPRARLAGETVVVVGYGEVGQRVARTCLALGMQVRAVARRARPAGGDVAIVGLDQLAEVVTGARYVVLCLPLTPATAGLVDAAILARLRSDAFVVDVARGGIVDETALAEALNRGHLAGAALDVFAQEPLPADSPLWSTPRLTITPHLAGLGERYLERCIGVLLGNARAMDLGAPRSHLVDRDAGY